MGIWLKPDAGRWGSINSDSQILVVPVQSLNPLLWIYYVKNIWKFQLHDLEEEICCFNVSKVSSTLPLKKPSSLSQYWPWMHFALWPAFYSWDDLEFLPTWPAIHITLSKDGIVSLHVGLSCLLRGKGEWVVTPFLFPREASIGSCAKVGTQCSIT